MNKKLPSDFKELVNSFPEYSYGTTKVKIELVDGRIYDNVIIAWAEEVIKVNDTKILPFDAGDICKIEYSE